MDHQVVIARFPQLGKSLLEEGLLVMSDRLVQGIGVGQVGEDALHLQLRQSPERLDQVGQRRAGRQADAV